MTYNGEPIAFCEIVNDSGEDLVNPTPDRIMPIRKPGTPQVPMEICSCEATNGGTITLTIRETWESEVWNTLPWVDDPTITIRELVNKDEISLQKIIVSHSGAIRGKTYHGCRITGVQTGEQVQIGNISIPKQVTISYTHTTPI
jgi:hypothetical protein